MKPPVLRVRARRDIEEAAAWYRREAGEPTALRLADALAVALRSIALRPAAGSPRWGHELNLPGLRSHRLKRFPYVLFYAERDDHIDVWRVLHARRDIPNWLPEL